jgi:hypothetical protein
VRSMCVHGGGRWTIIEGVSADHEAPVAVAVRTDKGDDEWT